MLQRLFWCGFGQEKEPHVPQLHIMNRERFQGISKVTSICLMSLKDCACKCIGLFANQACHCMEVVSIIIFNLNSRHIAKSREEIHAKLFYLPKDLYCTQPSHLAAKESLNFLLSFAISVTLTICFSLLSACSLHCSTADWPNVLLLPPSFFLSSAVQGLQEADTKFKFRLLHCLHLKNTIVIISQTICMQERKSIPVQMCRYQHTAVASAAVWMSPCWIVCLHCGIPANGKNKHQAD